MDDVVPGIVFGVGGLVSLTLGLAYVFLPRRLSRVAVRLAGGGYRLGPGFETAYTFGAGIIMTILGGTLLYVAVTG